MCIRDSLTLGQFHQLRIAGAGTVNELHTGQIFRAAGIRGTAAKQQRLIAVSYTHLIP